MKNFIFLTLILATFTHLTAFAQTETGLAQNEQKSANEDATFKQSETKLLEDSVTYAAKYRDVKLGIQAQEKLIAEYAKKKAAHQDRIEKVKDAQKDLHKSNKKVGKDFKADNSGLDAQGQAVIDKATNDIAELDQKTKDAEAKIAELKKDEVSEKTFDNKFDNFREQSGKVTANEKKRVDYANLVKADGAPKIQDPEPNKELKEVLATNSRSVIKNPPKAVQERSEKNTKEAAGANGVEPASTASTSDQTQSKTTNSAGASSANATSDGASIARAPSGSSTDMPGAPGATVGVAPGTGSPANTGVTGTASTSTAHLPASNVESLIVRAGDATCRDEALRAIATLANHRGVALSKLFRIASLKMAYQLHTQNRSTLESLVRSELSKGVPADAQKEVLSLYERFGKKEDQRKLTYYRSKDPNVELTRLNNRDASAMVLYMTQGKKPQREIDLNEGDAATVWAVEKVRAYREAAGDKNFAIGEEKGNLFNFSTTVYLAKNVDKLSPEQMWGKIRSHSRDLAVLLDRSFASLDDRLKKCMGGSCVTSGALSDNDKNDVLGMIRTLTVEAADAKSASIAAPVADNSNSRAPTTNSNLPAPTGPTTVGGAGTAANPAANSTTDSNTQTNTSVGSASVPNTTTPAEPVRQPAGDDDSPGAPVVRGLGGE